ncbi:MAG: sulfatase-like hydrolase/transferase [Spirochaetaceae bacterium]|nr:sulfatase-like hydrolase/transferase [Spirochaetaceae bacterium]
MDAPKGGERPNILMIMTDQQRWDSLSVTGAQGYETPNLDRLAAEGVLFDTCYCDNPICTPSRASLFTGKALPGHGVYRLHDLLPEDQTPFPYLLREAGYSTALFGKWHLSGRIEEETRRHPRDGFDIYEWCMEAAVSLDSPLNGYGRWLKNKAPDFYARLQTKGRDIGVMPQEYSFTRWAAERTMSFLDSQGRNESPWFCLMSVFDPHNPYDDAPPGFRERVGSPAVPIADPGLLDTNIPGIRAELEHSYLGASANLTDQDVEDMRRGYAASLVLLDDEVGRVLSVLEESGQADQTLVIFTSDHGDMLGDHGLYVKGAFFYEPSVRVPLILRWPGFLDPGKRIDAPVQLRDLAMTVMNAAGGADSLTDEEDVDSRDLAALAQGRQASRERVTCLYRNTGINDRGEYWDPPIHATMIRRGDWKLNWYHRRQGDSASLPSIQLFNLADDPNELCNLADDAAAAGIRRKLTEELLDEIARAEMNLGSRGGDARPLESQKINNFRRPTQ